MATAVLRTISKAQTNAFSGDPVGPAHRRASKAMARVLRHTAPAVGVPITAEGYVSVLELAEFLGRDPADLCAVVEHPAEQRFEMVAGHVRALYGHSFVVAGLDSVVQELPGVLFHGTTWQALSEVVRVGLLPMGRQAVHLTNDPNEALAVARRHGQRQVLLAVDTPGLEDVRAAMDAVWAVPAVDPRLLRLFNPHDQVVL